MRNASEATLLPDLPVRQCIGELRDSLARGHAVLTAEPGSGKTTLVPLLLCEESWLQGQRIVMLEPRRPAARMAARRMAQLLDEPVGGQVGYQVRFERRLSAATRIEVLTEGLLLRRLQADPELSGVGLVIFDEFHERNLLADLSLALCLDVVKGLRNDLRLLIMSATLDAQPLCRLLDAPLVSAQGGMHPVDCRFDRVDGEPAQAVSACLRLLDRALEADLGDVLVFLPGRREIEAFLASARDRHGGDALEFLPLHGGLDGAAQDRVLNRDADGPRRVIAATDIAETSLTLEGVTSVVDSGLARRPKFDPGRGLSRLETRRISRASATQRAGRAGRLQRGRAYRAWTRERHERLAAQGLPEILEADLAPALLELAAWGSAPEALDWLDCPSEAAWTQARALMTGLGAVSPGGTITALGREMARFPAHPRLARLLAVARTPAGQGLAADVAAVLTERDPLRTVEGVRPGADLRLRLDLLVAYRAQHRVPRGVDRAALRAQVRAAEQYLRLCRADTGQDARPLSLGQALLQAYPDRLAQRAEPKGDRYRLRHGRAVRLAPDDPLVGNAFLVAAVIDAGDREGRIFLAAGIGQAEVEEVLFQSLIEEREVRWDERVGDVVARRVRRLDSLVLGEQAVALEPGDPVFEVIAGQIRRVGLSRVLDLPDQLLARVEVMRRIEPQEGWPDFSVEGLQRDLEAWLQPWLPAGGGIRELRRHSVGEMLQSWLGPTLLRRLDRQLPVAIETPAGTRRRIHYAVDGEPVLAVPMQELFGEAVGPRLADGRIALVLHLLSPAGRPLQITRDLAGFWQGGYSDVKKEMRGRYPKHRWPDDPASAEPGRSIKRPRSR